MTPRRRHRGRPPTPAGTHHSESVEVRLTPALRASLERDAAAARLTLSDLCRARLGATGDDDGALRAAWLAGWRACAREAGARVEALGREAPGPEALRTTWTAIRARTRRAMMPDPEARGASPLPEEPSSDRGPRVAASTSAQCAVSNSQWHDDQAHKRRADIDSRLGDAMRASGINAPDALAVQALYATAGQSGSHRIVSALRAVEAWLREGGAR